MTLYEILDAFAHLRDREELTEADEFEIDSMQIELPKKLDSCCCLQRESLAKSEAYDAESKRFAALAKAEAAFANRLHLYVGRCMARFGIDSLETGRFKLSM